MFWSIEGKLCGHNEVLLEKRMPVIVYLRRINAITATVSIRFANRLSIQSRPTVLWRGTIQRVSKRTTKRKLDIYSSISQVYMKLYERKLINNKHLNLEKAECIKTLRMRGSLVNLKYTPEWSCKKTVSETGTNYLKRLLWWPYWFQWGIPYYQCFPHGGKKINEKWWHHSLVENVRNSSWHSSNTRKSRKLKTKVCM